MSDFMFIETNPKYHSGMQLDEYNGTISITSCREGKDGNVYFDWAFPQGRDRVPKEKAIPVKVNIGNSRQEAIDNLLRLVEDLNAGAIQKGQQPSATQQEIEEDIPF